MARKPPASWRPSWGAVVDLGERGSKSNSALLETAPRWLTLGGGMEGLWST